MIEKPKVINYKIYVESENGDFCKEFITLPVSIFPDGIPDTITRFIFNKIAETMLSKEDQKKVKYGDKIYKQGLADAWEAARKIAKLPFPKEIEVFGIHGYPAIVEEYSAIEVISKIKAYEEKQQNIDVGDEIIDSNGDKCVITHIFDNWFYGISQNGLLSSTSNKKIKKTGRHFPQVEEMFKGMKEE